MLRPREFVMKDSYTLDADVAALDVSYAAHEAAYRRIFDRCGLRYHVVQSDTGMMGGLGSHEFMAPSAAGEDEIALCPACGYAANVEIALCEAGGVHDILTKSLGTNQPHNVVLATEKADMALQLAAQVRNRIIGAYQEITRMNV